MKRKRHSAEQIVGHLREAEKMVSDGKTIAQVCKNGLRIDTFKKHLPGGD